MCALRPGVVVEGHEEDLPDGADLLHVLLQLRLRKRGQPPPDQLLSVQRLLPFRKHAISNIRMDLRQANPTWSLFKQISLLTWTDGSLTWLSLTLPVYAIWPPACP